MSQRSAIDPAAAGLLIVLCLIWGVGQVAIKVGNEGISPLWHAAIRSGGSALLLWGWSAWRGVPLWRRDGSGLYGVTIAALFALEFVCVYWGFMFTTASRGVLFIYSTPFFVALGAHWLFPGERLHGAKVVGLVLAFAGLAVVFADGLRLPTRREVLGDVLQLAGAVLWAATTLIIKARGQAVSPHRTLFYQLAGSAVLLGALAVGSGEPGVTRLTRLVAAAVSYQVVIHAFASYLAWFWLLTRYPASHLHAYTFWTPLFGVLAGWLLLGDPMTPALVLALACVAAGIYLVNRQPVAQAGRVPA
ncbi:MAG TPA: DMT family transporter [Methylomirabilota bacterium]|nr:DMT family transporter [Methylomirabilota bacterium]